MEPATAHGIASQNHVGQRDRFGDPVIDHLARVAAAVPPDARATCCLAELPRDPQQRTDAVLRRRRPAGPPRLRGRDQRPNTRRALRLRLRRRQRHQAPHQAPDLPAQPGRPGTPGTPRRLDRPQRDRLPCRGPMTSSQNGGVAWAPRCTSSRPNSHAKRRRVRELERELAELRSQRRDRRPA
jgi:hypothetical protein